MSQAAAVRRWFELRQALPGDSHTVNVAQLSLRPDEPFSVRHGVSLRTVHDLALAADTVGWWVLPSGQSGHPLAPHYGHMLSDWQRAAYYPLSLHENPRAPEAMVMQLTPASAGR
jgi:penicillin amidase